MNIRNWVFDNIVPDIVLKKMAKLRTVGKGFAIMYHEVLPNSDGPASWTVVRDSSFKEQMLYLKEYFDIVTMDEALIKASSPEEPIKPYVVVTFDDGYSGNTTCLLPIIEELQIPVTVFISTYAIEKGTVYWYDRVIALLDYDGCLFLNLSEYGLGVYEINRSRSEKNNWAVMKQLLNALKMLSPQVRDQLVENIVADFEVGKPRLKMMTRDEVVSLSSSPFVTIGGHSHCHNILTQLSDEHLNDSLNVNRKKLVAWTGQDVDHFSYPNGDFDDRIVAAVKKAGFISSVTTQGKLWASDVNVFELPRYGVGRFDSQGFFIARLAQLV